MASHIRNVHPNEKPRVAGTVRASSKLTASHAEVGYAGIIASLRRQKDAIDAALLALKHIGSAPVASKAATKKRKGGMTPEGRSRLIAALKRRWAEKKVAAGS